MCSCPHSPAEGVGSPGAGVIISIWRPDVGAGNQAETLSQTDREPSLQLLPPFKGTQKPRTKLLSECGVLFHSELQ